MSEETNKNDKAREEELAKSLDAKELKLDSSTTNEEADAMAAAVDKTGLGRVNMDNFGPEIARPSDQILGWHVLDLQTLPSKGKYYPSDIVIKIRSAKAAEIRHFSTMDEANYIDMEDKLNSIVESCSQLSSGDKRMSYKDILEEDRIVLLLSIRDLSFPEPENKLMLKGKTEKTKKSVEIELAVKNLVPTEIDEEIEKYYSEKEKNLHN